MGYVFINAIVKYAGGNVKIYEKEINNYDELNDLSYNKENIQSHFLLFINYYKNT